MEIFQGLVAEGKISILFSTHITSDLEKCADFITYIVNVEIVRNGRKGCFVAELSSDRKLQIRNEMILKQMLIDTSYYKSFGLTLDDVIELLKKVY